MLGCRQKMIMQALEEGCTTKKEIDKRSGEIAFDTRGRQGYPFFPIYGQYDPLFWGDDNYAILKRLIERGLIVRVSRGVYKKV